jgi:hypothetical protein
VRLVLSRAAQELACDDQDLLDQGGISRWAGLAGGGSKGLACSVGLQRRLAGWLAGRLACSEDGDTGALAAALPPSCPPPNAVL